jgi:hypothetical protein
LTDQTPEENITPDQACNPEPEIWDKWELEPVEWFKRFEKYRKMKPLRDLDILYEKEKAHYKFMRGNLRKFPAKSSWQVASRKYKWKERAESFDLEEIKQARVAEEQAKKDALKARQELLNVFHSKLLAYVASETFAIGETVKFSDITRAVQMISEQQRIEQLDMPAQALKMQFAGMSDQDIIAYLTSSE